eukprot:m.371654 g.371654  ORF g.371654 m.371654 type:complete len:335 (-) comp19991_c0_seq44:8758-9762(-)
MAQIATACMAVAAGARVLANTTRVLTRASWQADVSRQWLRPCSVRRLTASAHWASDRATDNNDDTNDNDATGESTPPRAQRDPLSQNPFFSKYADRIKQTVKDEPEALAEIEARKRVLHLQDMEALGLSSKRKPKSKSSTSKKQRHEAVRGRDTIMPEQQPSLDSILKLDLAAKLSPEELLKVWQQYHIDKDCLVAGVDAEAYAAQEARTKESPLFVVPLPREEGYEFQFLEFKGDYGAFTPLLEYKTHQENARAVLTLTFYTELKDSHGLVLMRGEIDTDRINAMESQCLVNQFQLYYNDKPESYKHAFRFNHRPEEFDYHPLIQNLETLSDV